MPFGYRRESVASRRDKERCDRYDDALPEIGKIGAVALFGLGILMTWRFLTVFDLLGFKEITRMLDSYIGTSWSFELLVGSVAMGAITTMVGCIGYVAIFQDRRNSLGWYFALLVPLFLGCFTIAVFTWTIDGRIGSALRRNSELMCAPENHIKIKALLGCSHAGGFPKSSWETDDELMGLVKKAKQYGGCNMLSVLCHKFKYTDVGTGACKVEHISHPGTTFVPAMIRSDPKDIVTLRCCQVSCDLDQTCRGFVHKAKERNCRLLASSLPSWNEEDQWKSIVEGEDDVSTTTTEAPPPIPTLVTYPPIVTAPPIATPTLPPMQMPMPTVPTVAPLPTQIGPERRLLDTASDAAERSSDRVGLRAGANWTSRELTLAQKRAGKHTPCKNVRWLMPEKPGEFAGLRHNVVGSTQKHGDGYCHRREPMTILEGEILNVGAWIAICSSVTAFALASSMMCTCALQYQMTPMRERKYQSRRRTLFRLMIPCCIKPKLSRSRQKAGWNQHINERWDSFSSTSSDSAPSSPR